MTENTMLAVAIASIAGCTAVGSYSSANKIPDYPGTRCVERAWTHADRMECVKAQVIMLAPKEAK